MFKLLATAFIEFARAWIIHSHNKLLEMIAQNSASRHQAKIALYQYEDAEIRDVRSIELTKLWLQDLEHHQAALYSAAGRTGPKAADLAGIVPPYPGTGNQKP